MKIKLILIGANVHLISYINLIKSIKKYVILGIIDNELEFELVKYNFKECYEQVI
ncbi:hypothetical protein N8822_01190 [Candidatus Pelagibacter ubique]|nr:hypothetical protein [Candidatus Pelagibacter ubique]